ncbi:hypothetical protein JOD54_004937 [Actinokineospora baliensis]|uniref:hypothetical protein n=1 Tax=Actinokineospora baliensis TaxID=547056 RepID=UPI00195BF1ED|nr:hypothetical protein [Actinokineospora baliensis]MBM7774733.1 hypothetical protein [Actinokineospora baliensis]
MLTNVATRDRVHSESQHAVVERVVSLLDTDGPLVVNLTGPLGVGKSAVLAAVAAEAPGRADYADGRAPFGPRVVVVSRAPLPLGDAVVVRVPRWSDEEIERLAVARGVDEHVDLVVRLAGGLPLVARGLCQALLTIPADVTGALADHVLLDVLDRLTNRHRDTAALDLLAIVGRGDEELLADLFPDEGNDLFTAIGENDLVQATDRGLAVAEPFRTLLDLRARWRRPVARRAALTMAATRTRQLLAAAREEADRASLAEHGLFLTDDPMIRRTLFPGGHDVVRPRPAKPGDHDRIAALVHRWVKRRGLDARHCERLLSGWLDHSPDGFHLVCDGDRAVGMAYIPRIDAKSVSAIEPLLQQHTDDLTDDGGVFVGMAVCDDAVRHAALLRHIVATGVRARRIVVATPWPEYQNLARGLGFQYVGDARHDPYSCGRDSEIYHHDLTSVPAWLDRLTTPTDPRRHVKQALEHLRDDTALTRNPLADSGPIALRTRVMAALDRLTASEDPISAEAGRALHGYYTQSHRNHIRVATDLHLSRATYFRRLDRGLTELTALLT